VDLMSVWSFLSDAGGGGYTPSARDRYTAAQREADYQRRQADRETEAADKIFDQIPALVAGEREKWAKAAATTTAEVEKAAAAEERRILGQPVTRYTGATHALKKLLAVWHHAVVLEGLGYDGEERQDAGLLLALKPGGGIDPAHVAVAAFGGRFPDTGTDAVQAWVAASHTALGEVRARYPVLPRLRDDRFMAHLLGAAGVCDSETATETVQGVYGPVDRRVTVIDVPRLTGVEVQPSGLVLTFGHRAGDSASRWVKALPALRAAFKAQGVDADALRVADSPDGNIMLHFDDADPFADAAATESVFDADRGRSLLGVTAAGQQAWITWNGSSGMVVGGVPGSGKTASMLPVFAAMAGQAELHVFDGKSGFDLEPLKTIARTYNRSGDIASPLETLRQIEELRTTRAEALHAAAGANNFWNMPLADRKRLGMVPVFVILDEVQTWTDVSGMDAAEKATAAEIKKLIRTLIQKGRSAGIVCVLTTQKPDATTIPTVIRDNAALKLCFRVSTPEQATTVLGGQAAGAPDPCAIPMKAKGRCVMETEGQGTVLVQAGYADPAAIAERLAEAEPVPDQLTVASRLLRGNNTDKDTGDPQPESRPPLTPEQVRAEAVRLGLLPPEDAGPETPTATGQPAPAKRAPRRPAPPKPTPEAKSAGEF